ncbi:MAG: hydroxyacylglutathione hydrolase [Pelagibacteraceae bacterium]
MISIDIISCLNDNYSYLLHDKKTNAVAIIDPSDFNPCDQEIEKKHKKLDYIINTHHHFDHVGGNEELKKKYGAKVLGFENDKDRIPGLDKGLKENENFKIGETSFKVIFVPGHTKGHVAFYSEQEKIIFTGDALFSLGCGRIFEGTYIDMFDSLKKIKNLPKKTKIYCGHEYTKNNFDFCNKYDTKNKNLSKKFDFINNKLNNNLPTIPVTLEDEINTNIFLRCDKSDIKMSLNMPEASEELIFKKLRDLKDEF